MVDVLGDASAHRLLMHWDRLRSLESENRVPLVVVPFMGNAAREFCHDRAINWLDLCGNASLRANGLRIRIEGLPNLFVHSGRPATVFGRRSARLTRVLLTQPNRDWSVREAARASALDEGLVSRAVARLVEDLFLIRDEKRRFRVRDPGFLADAWREAANFNDHHVVQGHIAARSGDALVKQLSTQLADFKVDYAATGLAAAWLYDQFAMFRLTTVYVKELPLPEQMRALGFREESEGANTWLVVPNDDGVFEGSREVDGVRCVHPVQVYVDLKDQPERSREASLHLRDNAFLFGGAVG